MTQKTLTKLKPFLQDCIEAGVDEVGRGCFAGPVVAAAVILPKDFSHPLVKDSKKLSEKQRLEAVEIIKKNAIAYSVAYGSVHEIDTFNILQATFKTMHKALDGLGQTPEHIIVDGDKFNGYRSIPHTCVVKGDANYYSIAAASILAKVERDGYMTRLAEQFPVYKWESNKGYGTADHREALLENGPTVHHRITFISNYVISKNNSNSLF
jgi:ribonuclease HII